MMKFISSALTLSLLLHCNLNAMEHQEKASANEEVSNYEKILVLVENLEELVAKIEKRMDAIKHELEEKAALPRRSPPAILLPPVAPEPILSDYESDDEMERFITSSPKRSASPQGLPVYEEEGHLGIVHMYRPGLMVPMEQIIAENQTSHH